MENQVLFNLSTEASKESGVIGAEYNLENLIEFLEEYSKDTAENRDDIPLWNLCKFKSSFPKTMDNVASVSGIILDFDGCLVDWQKVSAIFNKFTHIIYNSFNNGKKDVEKGTRFRLVLPFSKPLEVSDTVDTEKLKKRYEHIFDVLFVALHEAKLGGDKHNPTGTGIDLSKKNMNAFYYLPCKTDHTIWHVNHAKLMNPIAILTMPASTKIAMKAQMKNNIANFGAHTYNSNQYYNLSQPKIDQIIKKGLDIHAKPIDGNINFWKFADYLHWRGLQISDIQTALNDHYTKFNNPAERHPEIPRIISKLKSKAR